MITNERPSPYGQRTYSATLRPSVPEETLKTDKIQIERKTFVFTLKENTRGRFLRITEDVNGRRDTIIVPAPGFEAFTISSSSFLNSSNPGAGTMIVLRRPFTSSVIRKKRPRVFSLSVNTHGFL